MGKPQTWRFGRIGRMMTRRQVWLRAVATLVAVIVCSSDAAPLPTQDAPRLGRELSSSDAFGQTQEHRTLGEDADPPAEPAAKPAAKPAATPAAKPAAATPNEAEK